MKKINKIIFVIISLITVNSGLCNQWQVVGNMPYPVSRAEAVVIDSFIVIMGGDFDSLGVPINFIQVYNPYSNTWSIASQMVENRSGFVADKYMDSSIISCGGVWQPSLDMFSIEIWNYSNSMGGPSNIYNYNQNFGRINFTGHVYNENLYIIGGFTSPAIGDTLQFSYIIEYHIPSASVSFTMDTIYNGFFLPYDQMSQIVNDEIYIFGGALLGLSDEIHKFNISTRIFEQVGNLLGKRAGGEAVHSNDNIYIIGGYNELNSALNSVEIFDTSTNSLVSGPQLNYERSKFAAVKFKNSIYVFGGVNNFSFSEPSIERLDLITNIEIFPDEKPESFQLKNNYPNPFNSTTTLFFSLNKDTEISLDIYTVEGKHIKNIVNGKLSTGEHRYLWDGTNHLGNEVASGIYIYTLKNKKHIESNKMILLR